MKSMFEEMRAQDRFDRDWHDRAPKPLMQDHISAAAELIRKAAKLLDKAAKADPAKWNKFEPRFCDAGSDKLELIADECELIAGIIEHGAAVHSIAAE
jgi:hypothetical protein